MTTEFKRFRYHVLDPIGPANPLIQPGELAYFPTDAIPAGWLKADGAYYAPSAQPALFQAIGYRHGKDAQGRFRVLEVVDFVEHIVPGSLGVPYALAADAVRSHGHGGGSLGSAGAHNHSITVTSWHPITVDMWYVNDHQPTGDAGGDFGLNYLMSGNHSHGVTATGGGGVETAPRHVILSLCVCATSDAIVYLG